MKFIKSLVTDGQWDGDLTKVFGIALIVVGIIGWFRGLADPQWIVGLGCTLAASGKFSAQG